MSKSFDFVVEAKEVIIKKKCHNKYQVKMAGVGDFLKYQTWSSTNTNNVNGKRGVSFVNVKNWVQNNFPEKKLFNITGGPVFTPTAIMEVCNKKYIFVIESATYNKNKKYNTVLNVSTTQIVKNNITKDLVKLPVNKKLNNVRFDIDSNSSNSVSLTRYVNTISQTSTITGNANYGCSPAPSEITFSYDTTTNNVTSFTIGNPNKFCPTSSPGTFFSLALPQVFYQYTAATYDPANNAITVSGDDGVKFTLNLIDSLNLVPLTQLTYGSSPILIGADKIDLTQVGVFIFNVFTLQDCIAQSLSLFLNPASYWTTLVYDYFNINNPNQNDGNNAEFGCPNSDWLPNFYGGGPSYWYNCVGPEQNYVAYQLLYFAMFYAYINYEIQGNGGNEVPVTVPVYSCNTGQSLSDDGSTVVNMTVNNPVLVANLTFVPIYPLNLNTLSLEVLRVNQDPFNPTGNATPSFTYGYSSPTNSQAPYFYEGTLSFDNIGFVVSQANGSTTINRPVHLSQCFTQSSFDSTNPIKINTNSSKLITVTQTQSSTPGFGQVAMLSFVTFSGVTGSLQNVSTPNSFLGNSPQTVTINASQGSQTSSTTLTINPIVFDIASSEIYFTSTLIDGEDITPPYVQNPPQLISCGIYPPGCYNPNPISSPNLGIQYTEFITEIFAWFVPFAPFPPCTSSSTISINPPISSSSGFTFDGRQFQFDSREYNYIEGTYILSTTLNTNPGFVYPSTSETNDFYSFSNSVGNGYTAVDILYTFPNQYFQDYVDSLPSPGGF